MYLYMFNILKIKVEWRITGISNRHFQILYPLNITYKLDFSKYSKQYRVWRGKY